MTFSCCNPTYSPIHSPAPPPDYYEHRYDKTPEYQGPPAPPPNYQEPSWDVPRLASPTVAARSNSTTSAGSRQIEAPPRCSSPLPPSPKPLRGRVVVFNPLFFFSLPDIPLQAPFSPPSGIFDFSVETPWHQMPHLFDRTILESWGFSRKDIHAYERLRFGDVQGSYKEQWRAWITYQIDWLSTRYIRRSLP